MPLRSGNRRGFTLLEILVVLAVIGVTVTLATLSVGADRDGRLKREAERLGSLIRLARDEAVITSQPIALDLRSDGYRFLERAPSDAEGAWQARETSRLFGAHRVPAYVRLRSGTDGIDTTGASAGPDAVIRPTGLTTPFEVVFDVASDQGQGWRLQVPPSGALQLQAVE